MKKEIKVKFYFDDKEYSDEESNFIIRNLIKKLAEIKGEEIDDKLINNVFLPVVNKNKKG